MSWLCDPRVAAREARAGLPRKTEDRSVQKDAYTLILEAIEAGVYKPGDRLVESELA